MITLFQILQFSYKFQGTTYIEILFNALSENVTFILMSLDDNVFYTNLYHKIQNTNRQSNLCSNFHINIRKLKVTKIILNIINYAQSGHLCKYNNAL